MNKFNRFALMSAIALTGSAGFTACSSEDELANTNPTFDGESVKTQFTINVPAASKSTRLGTDIVQGQDRPVFRGMDNINMFAFKTTEQGDTASVVTTSNTPEKAYLGMGGITQDGLQSGTNSKVYYDIDIPTEVNRFLFYGEATRVQGTTDKDNGRLNATYPTSTVNDIKFELQTIANNGNTTTEGTLLTALNNVAQAKKDSPETYWYSSTDEGLKSLYQAFTQLKAGSANSIREALAYLKEGLNKTGDGSFNITDNDLKNAIIAQIDAAIDETSGSIKDLTYPRDINLPDGAVELKYDDTTHSFSYATSKVDGGSSITVGSSAAKISDYVYPAALYYWTDSPILVSDEVESTDYTKDWTTCLSLYGDYDSNAKKIESSTRSVALRNKIQYAVARLDLSAWFNDNNGNVKDNVGNDVDVTTTTGGMNLVGLLVGGQKNVKFNFSDVTDDATEKSVYDASITPTALGEETTTDVIAQTLLLETAPETNVRFAIELENNTGNSFVGEDGTVPAGGRFYLIGELKYSTDSKYESMEKRVFKQDHTTTAKVSINSLAHAYNTIPDLREPKLELGLSVDLEWQEGLVADVVID